MDAENTVIEELKAIGKPFLVLLNCAQPKSAAANAAALEISTRHQVPVMPVNCLELDGGEIEGIIRSVLYEFPIRQLRFRLPEWVSALKSDSPIKSAIFEKIRSCGDMLSCMRDAHAAASAMAQMENVTRAEISEMDLGRGSATINTDLPRSLFYSTVSESSGFDVQNDGDLLKLLASLADVKKDYDRVSGALEQARATGYGVVLPVREEMSLEEPEVIKQGGRYGVRLRASAPAIHMLSAEIKSEISPSVGSQQQSEDLINSLMGEGGDKEKLWEANIFGKSLFELVNEELTSKVRRVPEDVKGKFRGTIGKIVNDGSGTLICIIF